MLLCHLEQLAHFVPQCAGLLLLHGLLARHCAAAAAARRFSGHALGTCGGAVLRLPCLLRLLWLRFPPLCLGINLHCVFLTTLLLVILNQLLLCRPPSWAACYTSRCRRHFDQGHPGSQSARRLKAQRVPHSRAQAAQQATQAAQLALATGPGGQGQAVGPV